MKTEMRFGDRVIAEGIMVDVILYSFILLIFAAGMVFGIGIAGWL